MNRKFQVTTGVVGFWRKGDVFTESEFRRLHPAPPQEDAAAYHAALIDRLLDLAVIQQAADDAPVTVTALAGHGMSISDAAAAVVSRRALTA
jgi:hypothetical protein